MRMYRVKKGKPKEENAQKSRRAGNSDIIITFMLISTNNHIRAPEQIHLFVSEQDGLKNTMQDK